MTHNTQGADAVKADSYTPPADVARNARRALEVRQSKPESQRGMTPVGIARATQLANRRPVSVDTLQRMVAYFDRHEVDKQGSTWDEQGKGWQAWYGWGGDAGRAWARGILQSMKETTMNDESDMVMPTEDMPEGNPQDSLGEVRKQKIMDIIKMLLEVADLEVEHLMEDEMTATESASAGPGQGNSVGDGGGVGDGTGGGSVKVDLTAEERDAMPDRDFAIPSSRNFPINSPVAVSDAVAGWGRYEGPVSFEEFKRNLIAIAKRKGADYVAALPQSWKDEMENAVKAAARRILGQMG